MNVDSRAGKTRGFTVTELLITLAIVAALAAILLPVFTSVRERGRRTVCQSNLKQMALAMQQYVQDNNETYPIESNWIKASYSRVKNAQVFRCPDGLDSLAGHGYTRESPDTPEFPVDYAYDVRRLNVFYIGDGWERYDAVRESDLNSPAAVWLNMDIYDLGDPTPIFVRRVTTSCGIRFNGNTTHSGGGDYSYLDGHVKWLPPEAAGEIDCANGPQLSPVYVKD